MENSTIEVKKENGEISAFNINSEVQKGLYLTTETSLINDNIRNLNIDIEMVPNQIAMKVSKLENSAVITFAVDENRKYQYLVGADLDVESLEKTNSDKIPEQIKGLIVEAYALTQKK